MLKVDEIWICTKVTGSSRNKIFARWFVFYSPDACVVKMAPFIFAVFEILLLNCRKSCRRIYFKSALNMHDRKHDFQIYQPSEQIGVSRQFLQIILGSLSATWLIIWA